MNLQALQAEWQDYSGSELEGSPAWDDSPRGTEDADSEPADEPASSDD